MEGCEDNVLLLPEAGTSHLVTHRIISILPRINLIRIILTTPAQFRKSAKTKKAKVLDVLIHATAWYLGVADKKFTNKTSQEKIDKYNADVQAYGIALHE